MGSESFKWTFAGAPVSVDLELGFVEAMKRHVLRARGGECRGILLGNTNTDSPIRVRITGFRSAPADDFPAAIRACLGHPAAPVGYYRFSSQERIRLDKDDLAIAEACFRDPACVFLIGCVSPDTTAGLFFWDEGQIHSDFSFLEFPFDAEALREPVSAPPGRKLPRALAAVGAVSLVSLAALLVPWRSASTVHESATELGLHYELRGSLVRVAWDPTLAVVRNARAGVLSVQEGGRENGFLLAADQLRTGAMFYPRAGAGGSIHLRLEVADSAARRIAQELTATFSPIQSGIARPPATAVRVEPAPRPFQPPSLPATAGQPTEPPELPTVSMPSAPEPNLPLSATAVIPPPPVAAAPAPPQPAVYVPPKPLNLSRPVLPSSIAATVRTKTRVQVKVTIDPKGNVVAAEPVATDTKSRLLAGIVANSARYWRFEPARRDGAPILADLVVNIDYEAGGR